jgi:cytochrome oxidase Cu insertion factor (SCO1/SenC/PrrC family)
VKRHLDMKVAAACLVLIVACAAYGADGIRLAIPDAAVLDQNGRQLRFRSDLIDDRLVVVNFIFTSCTTICSPMGANFAALQKRLGAGTDVHLVSVSLDPAADSPARLKAWSERFGAQPGWTLVTGARGEIDKLLKGFGVYTPDRINHTPILIVGDGRRNVWTRANGLLAPPKIAGMIEQLRVTTAANIEKKPAPDNGAKSYFADLVLTDQDGRTVKLYDDVMAGKTVVINSFFATCHGSCPVMSGNFVAIQKAFADRLGKDLVLVSITVDPQSDTPEKLRAYAKSVKAQPGWYFLTGAQENVDKALRRLGQYVEDKNDHQNLFLVGNLQTGLWKKAFGLAKPDDLVKVVESVLNDRG